MTSDEARTPTLSRRLRAAFARLTLPVVLVTALSLVPGPWWADLMTHFRPQYVLAGLVGLVAAWPRRGLAAAHAAALAVNLALVAQTFVGGARAAADERDVRIFSVNVYSENRAFDDLLGAIEDLDPDIIVLLEVTEEWVAQTEELRERYPHRVDESRSDNFGIVVYSRPPMQARVVYFGHEDTPSVVLETDALPGTQVIGTHPLPPVGPRLAAARDAQLEEIGEYVASSELETVVIGDLNASPWSRPLRALLSDAELERAGRGFRPTWPMPFPPLWISIDHALVSEGLVVSGYRVGPAVGSDHLPVSVDVRRR